MFHQPLHPLNIIRLRESNLFLFLLFMFSILMGVVHKVESDIKHKHIRCLIFIFCPEGHFGAKIRKSSNWWFLSIVCLIWACKTVLKSSFLPPRKNNLLTDWGYFQKCAFKWQKCFSALKAEIFKAFYFFKTPKAADNRDFYKMSKIDNY